MINVIIVINVIKVMGHANTKARAERQVEEEVARVCEEEEEEEEEGREVLDEEEELNELFSVKDSRSFAVEKEEEEEEEEEFEGADGTILSAKCDLMCALDERAKRTELGDFSKMFESAESEMLKKFSRTFDGCEDSVRTLKALEMAVERIVSVIDASIFSDDEGVFQALTVFVWDRVRAVRGCVSAQSAKGKRARKIMRTIVRVLIRFDYEIRRRMKIREYSRLSRSNNENTEVKYDVIDKTEQRKENEDKSMARLFREQLGKTLATYSSMTACNKFATTEEKSEILAFRLLLRMAAKIEEDESNNTETTATTIQDLRGAEDDVMNTEIVKRAIHLSVCIETGQFVSFFKTISSSSMTFLEYCCVFASVDKTRSRFLSRMNKSHNKTKSTKADLRETTKISSSSTLEILLRLANVETSESDPSEVVFLSQNYALANGFRQEKKLFSHSSLHETHSRLINARLFCSQAFEDVETIACLRIQPLAWSAFIAF